MDDAGRLAHTHRELPVPSTANMPRLSIITASRNRAALLSQAMDSVFAEAKDGIELIVVDGQSNDGTAELLARYPSITVVRHPPRGVYDAFNKGLEAATGDIVCFLNGDDLLAPGGVGVVRETFGSHPEVDVVCCGATAFEYRDGDWKTFRAYRNTVEIDLNVRSVTTGVPLLNAKFFRRSLIERIGQFDVTYRFAADRDFLIRIIAEAPTMRVVPAVVYQYRKHAGSLTLDQGLCRWLEIKREHVALSAAWSARADAPRAVQKAASRWYHEETAKLLVRNESIGARLQVARQALERSRLWPVRAVAAGASIVMARLSRRLRPGVGRP